MGDIADKLENMAIGNTNKLELCPYPIQGAVRKLCGSLLEYLFVIYPIQMILYRRFLKLIKYHQKSDFFLFEQLFINIYDGFDLSDEDVLLILNSSPVSFFGVLSE